MTKSKLHSKAKKLLAEHLRLMRRLFKIRSELRQIDSQLFGT
jgi:hypothetical protein